MKLNTFLIVIILITALTVGTISAADNNDQNTILNVPQSTPLYESDNDDVITVKENINNSICIDDENNLGQNSNNEKEVIEMQETGDSSELNYNKYYLFRGDCWIIYNNFESSAAVTSESIHDLTVSGTFRTQKDQIGLYWNSQDIIQHPYISYGNHSNYSDVILEFDYEMTGCKDFSDNNIVITIAANTGETYYLTMNRFIKNNHVTLDFNKLTLLNGNSYFNKNGERVQVSQETKLNVENLKYIMLTIEPANYDTTHEYYTIMENKEFSCKISNITVTNGEIGNEHPALKPHQYRLCEGYDDIYNLNPFRLCKEMRKLGYTEWVDLYIGASNYYEKNGTPGDMITDLEFTNQRTEKMVLDKNMNLNSAFKAWLDCYSRELKKYNVENLIISVSMENLQCPENWRQMDANGNFAKTGWNPSTFLYSPCNDEVIQYMQKISESCLDIVVNNGLKPILQMGETWWWWDETPYFYDNSTKLKYFENHSTDMPKYTNVNGEYDKNVTKWLNQQLVKYSDALCSIVKSDKYNNGLYMALFFPPSVTDIDKVPQMIIETNYIKDAYSPSKLDILQIEDYDWVTDESQHHSEAYQIGQELGFNEEHLHYFGGFVQNPEDASRLWELIENAMDEAIEKNFKEVFVWAGLQIRRDNKIIGCDENEIITNLIQTAITSPEYVSTGEKFTIEIQTQKWVNGQFHVYSYINNVKEELLASAELNNGKSSVNLSSNIAGVNNYYLEFDYSDGSYNLVEKVIVIENSKNITVNIPLEMEKGSYANITFDAPESTSNSLYISIDGKDTEKYCVQNGRFTQTIHDLEKGYHTVSIKYRDKSSQEIYSNTFIINVGVKTIINTADMITYYRSEEKLIVSLKENSDNPLCGKTVIINLNGLNHTATTDDDGKLSFKVDLLPGNYNAKILFNGDGGYLSSSYGAKIIVNQIITSLTANNVKVTYGDASKLIITLKDNFGNVLSKQNVYFKLNNKNYNLITDSKGQVKLSVILPAKDYTVKINFAGSNIYKSTSKTIKITVKKASVKLIASSKKFKLKAKTKKVTVTLKNKKNKPLTRTIIKLTIKKKTYKAKTNSKGVATFKVKLTKKGKYNAVYRYAGNSNYISASKKIKITLR